jgi:hypothetical protein
MSLEERAKVPPWMRERAGAVAGQGSRAMKLEIWRKRDKEGKSR